jgi:DNA-directed RNA polymerase specialized sigma24 family protein
VRGDLGSVCAAIESLNERDRQLVGLRVAAGLSYAEVAAVVNMREGAARMATHRALEHVRATLRAEP